MLRGQKVILRGKRLEDAENDYAWRSDEELARLDAAPTMRIPFAYFLDNYADENPAEARKRLREILGKIEGGEAKSDKMWMIPLLALMGTL